MYRDRLKEAVFNQNSFRPTEDWLDDLPLKQGYLFLLPVDIINERKKIN
jgi:hypothetical protein